MYCQIPWDFFNNEYEPLVPYHLPALTIMWKSRLRTFLQMKPFQVNINTTHLFWLSLELWNSVEKTTCEPQLFSRPMWRFFFPAILSLNATIKLRIQQPFLDIFTVISSWCSSPTSSLQSKQASCSAGSVVWIVLVGFQCFLSTHEKINNFSWFFTLIFHDASFLNMVHPELEVDALQNYHRSTFCSVFRTPIDHMLNLYNIFCVCTKPGAPSTHSTLLVMNCHSTKCSTVAVSWIPEESSYSIQWLRQLFAR